VTLILLNRSLDTPSAQGANKLVTVAPVEDADAESPGLIARKYSVARTAIEAGDFSKAEGVFSSILADENVQEPTRTWSGLQAVVAAMMDGRMDRAKKNAAAADEHIAGEPEGLEPGFNLGVRPVLSQISGFGFIDFASLQLGDGSERFMGLFLAGLKNWEHGGLEKAVPFFKAVSSESSIADDAVLSWYRKSARMYLMDYEALTSGVLDVDPETVEGCREAIEELNRQLTILNTQGRARFNIRARQIELAKLEKVLKKAPKPAPEPDRDVMMEIATFAENYQFVEIVDLTSKLKYNPPGSKRRSLRGIAESALVFLTEMESDLQKKPAVINMSLKDGAEIVSIAMTSEGKLVGKLSSGEIRDLQWIDFSTVELIELHRELVKNPASEMERLRRHESAIAFEWLAGDRERALAAAGRLSEENNGFKERWNTLASGLPK
jgi:hypothetical protein